ncbi:MAG: tol-pal system protein YbgF, partial [Pseudolabrys sp.]
MKRSRPPSRTAALAAISVLLLTASALAQDQRGSGNFLDNLFNRGEQTQSRQQSQSGRMEQADPSDVTVRLDRMESALRQLTGTLEQLQYRNQQLEAQLKRMQDDTEYRFQQLGSRGGVAPPAQAAPATPGNAPMAPSGRRSDVFD